MNKRGSEWRKWNFHVHTKGTNKNDQFSSKSMEEFFVTFFKKAFIENISAIGITDYFSIDRYNDAIKFQKEIDEKYEIVNSADKKIFTEEEIKFIKNIFIFPNVELRMLPSTDRGKLINIHCLFNPDYISSIENDFFSSIENQDKFKMNRQGITDYGKHLDSLLKIPEEQYKNGINNFVIDLKSLKEVLSTNKNLRDNTLLVVSNSNKDGASAIQQHYDLFENEAGCLDGLRSSIYSISNMVFSANPKDIKYFLGKRLQGTIDYNEEKYQQEIKDVINKRGSLKPCIIGCDAHKEDELFEKFTWVKSDLNFEGLRQICFEPEQRIRIQADKPDFKEEKLIIDNVKFISPNNVFSTTPIHLNPNLNVIIGGKSSGKSILLYSIAKTLVADNEILKNDDGSDKYDLRKVETEFDFEITTSGGFSQKLFRNPNENSILPEIKYIPQNYLVKLAEPEVNKKGKSLNKLVRDLIVEDRDSNEIYQDFLSKVRHNDKLRNSLIDTFFETKNNIDTLENELKTKSNKEVLDKNIRTNSQKIEDLNKRIGLSQEKVNEYKSLQEKVEKNKEKIQHFKDDFGNFQNFNSEVSQTISAVKLKKDSFIDSIQSEALKVFYNTLYREIDDFYIRLSEIEEKKGFIANEDNSRTYKLKEIDELAQSIRKEKTELHIAIEPFLKDEATKKLIDELNQSIANDKKTLIDIDNLIKKIVLSKQQLADIKKQIFDLYDNNYKEYEAVIESLKNRTSDLEKEGLSIIGKVLFNYPKLRKSLLDISDGRSASYSRYSLLENSRKSSDDCDYSLVFEDIKQIFEDILSKEYGLTSRTTTPNAIKTILDDFFFDFWEIKYKNDKLGEMSTGKASFVILMLIIGLSKSKSPFLIDQPEDNLDNRSITTDLVNYLRNKKIERQIIIVTHNANIVVNADSENVIVANQKGQTNDENSSSFIFDYINGSIENSFDKIESETDILKSMGIRQHIADIVEGGKDAFMKREKKYRFN